MAQLAKKRRRPPDFYLCIAPRDKSAVVEFITTGSNALGEAHFHLCLHCQSLIMAGATAMRDKCVEKVKAMADEWDSDHRYGRWYTAAHSIASQLTFVSLDQVKP